MTKDEEEVAETLFALANMMPTFEPVEDKEDQKASEDMSNINATNASHSEGSVHPHPTHNPPPNNPEEDFFRLLKMFSILSIFSIIFKELSF